MSLAGKVVAVVDDEEGVRLALGRLLRAEGSAVEAFASAEAFLAAPWPAPDCLVLDLGLPGMSGPELLRRLEGEGRPVPAVFITARAGEAERQAARRAGAAALLEKPFEGWALVEAVRRAAGAAGSATGGSRTPASPPHMGPPQ